MTMSDAAFRLVDPHNVPMTKFGLPMKLNSPSPIRTVKEDRLGRGRFSSRLAALIDAAGEGALVVGIDGKWGSGKSSSVEMAVPYLLRSGHRIIRVNAWRTGSQEHFLSAVRLAMATSLRRDWGGVWFWLLWARLKRQPDPTWFAMFAVLFAAVAFQIFPDFAKLLGPLASIDLSGVLSAIGFAGVPLIALGATYLSRPFAEAWTSMFGTPVGDSDLHAAERFNLQFDIYAEVLRRGTRYVIVVEDIDRCAAARVADVMADIANLCTHDDASRLAFVLPFDRKDIVSKLSAANAESPETAEAVLRRIVHIDIALPKAVHGDSFAGKSPLSPPKLPVYVRGAAASFVLVFGLVFLSPIAKPTFLGWFVLGAAIIVVGPPVVRWAMVAKRSPKADRAWSDAVARADGFLPRLPRDRTRAINLAMAVAVMQDDGRMSPWQLLTLSALVVRWPSAINPDYLSKDTKLNGVTYGNADIERELDALKATKVDVAHFRSKQLLIDFISVVQRSSLS